MSKWIPGLVLITILLQCVLLLVFLLQEEEKPTDPVPAEIQARLDQISADIESIESRLDLPSVPREPLVPKVAAKTPAMPPKEETPDKPPQHKRFTDEELSVPVPKNTGDRKFHVTGVPGRGQ
ncbi:MAG: hypothetical protein AAF517_28060 [Planctomycetota bacterium]